MLDHGLENMVRACSRLRHSERFARAAPALTAQQQASLAAIAPAAVAAERSSGYPAEGYYCVNSSGVLTWVSNVSSPPNTCTSVGSASTVPADYVVVQTTYTFAPIFPGLSVGGLLPTSLTSTSYVRLG